MSTATVTKRKRPSTTNELIEPSVITFSSDLLTPEEERELLTSFWDCKSELVRVMVRHFPDLRANKPPLEPWPMAQYIRDNVNEDRRTVMAVRRLHDRYVHFKHRLASANIRLAAHVAKRFRHHALSSQIRNYVVRTYSERMVLGVCVNH